MTWVLCLMCLAPAEPGLQTRAIVREHVNAAGQLSPELAAATGWSRVLAFQWQMHVLQAGEYQAVRPDQVFQTGTRFRLKVIADTNLWIYVLNRDPLGDDVVLLPETGEEHLLVEQGKEVLVPPDGVFRFTGQAGTEQFRIIVSPTKLTWVNPRELFNLQESRQQTPEANALAQAQSASRTKSITALQAKQAGKVNLTSSLATVVAEGRDSRTYTKDTVLAPPPTEDGQMVLQGMTNANENDAIVIDVALRHGP